MTSAGPEAATPKFWRDDALAFIEMRSIENGREVHYGKHAHETFSIGAITSGTSTYLNGMRRQRVSAGSVVLMNPGDVHACSPIGDAQWSYRMLYVDVPWLASVQHDLGVSRSGSFRPFSATSTTNARLYRGLNRLCDTLCDPGADLLQKQEAALTFMSDAQLILGPAKRRERGRSRSIERAAEFIRDNYKRSLKLPDICAATDLSASYLIRAFKEEYGMTPHAYLVNCRIEFARSRLRRGATIAEVALESGFSDQAHLQRAFKRFVAATPRQYQG